MSEDLPTPASLVSGGYHETPDRSRPHSSSASSSPASAARPQFFVFDNGVGSGSWTPEQQAKTVKELGYDGISYNYTTPEDLVAWQKALGAQG